MSVLQKPVEYRFCFVIANKNICNELIASLLRILFFIIQQRIYIR